MASSCLVISAPCGDALALLLLPPLESLRFFEAAARHQDFATWGSTRIAGWGL